MPTEATVATARLRPPGAASSLRSCSARFAQLAFHHGGQVLRSRIAQHVVDIVVERCVQPARCLTRVPEALHQHGMKGGIPLLMIAAIEDQDRQLTAIFGLTRYEGVDRLG
ncbi:MAG: hypothetical protein HC900_09160, partial [Methylacidiphilales bacterium]|nr:hypothetical protein [Candidatus Methylacidiphilales bacterium]